MKNSNPFPYYSILLPVTLLTVTCVWRDVWQCGGRPVEGRQWVRQAGWRQGGRLEGRQGQAGITYL